MNAPIPYTDHSGELAAYVTPVTWGELRDGFCVAHDVVFHDPITIPHLAVLMAQSDLETGRRKAIWRMNFGNKKAGRGYISVAGNHHQYFRCNERLPDPNDGGKLKYFWFDPTHAQTRFRAYLTAAQGLEAQVRFLGTASNPARGNRYQAAWDAARAGDPAGYCDELAKARYFTAGLGPYKRAVVSIFGEYMRELGSYKVKRAESMPVAPTDVPTDAQPDVYVDHDAEDTEIQSAFSAIDMAEMILEVPWDAINEDKKKRVLGMFEDDA